jgi:hypothetical protein
VLFNPELRRNIWLDFTLHKTIITPVTILLIAYLAYLSGSAQASANTSYLVACFFIFLWGTKKASETVVDEINNSTWDFQRQSSISPWSMTLGKLIGSTIYTWYGAFIALTVYFLLSNRPSVTVDISNLKVVTPSVELYVLMIVLCGLFTQALTLLLSIQSLTLIRREKANKTFRYFLSGTILGAIVTSYCMTAITLNFNIPWYQFHFDLRNFAICSLLLFLGWLIVGLYRTFCKELQYQHVPWIWLAFNLFCLIYFPGLVPTEGFGLEDLQSITKIETIQKLLQMGPWYVAFLIIQVLTYTAVFADEITRTRYKRLVNCAHEKNIHETLQHLPWWTISYFLTVVVAFLVLIKQQHIGQIHEDISLNILVITSTLYLARDILLIHYFNFRDNPKKAMSTSIFYLFLIYLLLPFLLNAMHLGSVVPLLIPSWGENTALAIISVLAQIGFLGFLCLNRWQLAWKD